MTAVRRMLKYTLVEMLVVVGLIAILMGLSLGVYSYVQHFSNIAKTKAIMKQIEVGLEAVKTKYGYYPQTPMTSDGKYPTVYAFVMPVDDGSGTCQWEIAENLPQDYIKTFVKTVEMNELASQTVELGQQRNEPKAPKPTLTDAWGYPIYYRAPGVRNKSSYDLASVGPDGYPGEGYNHCGEIRTFWYQNTREIQWSCNGIRGWGHETFYDTNPAFDTENSDDICNF